MPSGDKKWPLHTHSVIGTSDSRNENGDILLLCSPGKYVGASSVRSFPFQLLAYHQISTENIQEICNECSVRLRGKLDYRAFTFDPFRYKTEKIFRHGNINDPAFSCVRRGIAFGYFGRGKNKTKNYAPAVKYEMTLGRILRIGSTKMPVGETKFRN